MARKQQDILDRLMGGVSIRGFLLHPAMLSILATGALIGGAIFLWECNRETITRLEEYQLTAEKIELPPVPEWADQDLRELILESSPEDVTSILDTQLVSRTASVVEEVGFVEFVRTVEKSKRRLKIDLVYRQPVAVVELSKTTFPPRRNSALSTVENALVPVDRHGVLMPETILDQSGLPKILIFWPAQAENRSTWSAWPDQRIHDAAAISSLFAATAESIGLKQIVSKRHPELQSYRTRPFELWPTRGTRVIWGNAPGKETEGEASVEEKLLALNEFIEAYGPLQNKISRTIDIRSGIAVPVTNMKTAARPENLFSDLK